MTPIRAVLAALILVIAAACSDQAPQEADTDVATYERIVTLAPNLTELAFTAGAGAAVIGVSAWSDEPTMAKRLPVIGDAFMLDRERLAQLQPDLLLAWHGGTPAHVVDELRAAGFNVEVLRTDSLADVSNTLRRIGQLAGSEPVANLLADEFDTAIANIADRHRDLPDLRVFYQVSRRPLYTINGEHYLSELIGICGGTNIFADLEDLAPTVDVEAVVDRDPEALLTSTDDGADAFADWQRWPNLAANRYNNHFLISADVISRATTRLTTAASAVCTSLQQARDNKASVENE